MRYVGIAESEINHVGKMKNKLVLQKNISTRCQRVMSFFSVMAGKPEM